MGTGIKYKEHGHFCSGALKHPPAHAPKSLKLEKGPGRMFRPSCFPGLKENTCIRNSGRSPVQQRVLSFSAMVKKWIFEETVLSGRVMS